MRTTTHFDQSKTTVIIDGALAEQFMSGDSVRVNRTTAGAALDVGFDGATTMLAVDPSGTVELDFKGTSATLDTINELWEAQQNGLGRLFDIQLVTSATEMVRCANCAIQSPGNIATGGNTASARTVIFTSARIFSE